MNAYSAFFSTARRNDERSNWINGKERERKTETKRKDESGAKTREGGREREREREGDIRKLSGITEKAATSEQR